MLKIERKMASYQRDPEVVTGVSRCKDIVSELLRCDVIAMDAEGVQLGKDGPMTLLQIGTMDHTVYLFDVQENRSLFTKGGLQDLLQSTAVTKVIHSCSGDSAALFYQFNIQLQAVFDTQVAHLVIEEDKGRLLAQLLKLEDICKKYSKTSKVADQKETLKDKWMTEVGDLWAKRPLTEDMIQYAAGDVIALVPEVYEQQYRYIQDHRLVDKFKERVKEEILISVDDTLVQKRRNRVDEAVKTVLRRFQESGQAAMVKYCEITDEDVQRAIMRVSIQDAQSMSVEIDRLKTDSIVEDLKEVESFIANDDDVINKRHFLHLYRSHPNESIRNKANQLQKQIDAVFLKYLARKYEMGTELKCISDAEKRSLRRIRPKSSTDPEYPPVVLDLYWRLMESDLNNELQKLQQQKRQFSMNDGYYKKIKFFMHRNNNGVPQSLKRTAASFVKTYDNIFGRRR